MPDTKIIFTCQLSKKRHDKLKKLAKELERSVNSLVVEGIVLILNRYAKDLPPKKSRKKPS